MENKFIDRNGLKVLWNQINLKDYPNNETLMAVIDAIDETKLDKNEHSWDNLLNKPFGEGVSSISKTILDTTMSSEEMSLIEDENGENKRYYFNRSDYDRYYKSGSTFDIILNGVVYENVPLQVYVSEEDGEMIAGQYFGDYDFIEYPFWIYIILSEEVSTYVTIVPAAECKIYLDNNNYTTLTILAQEPTTGLLDEKYIPDTIARTATTLEGYGITDAATKEELNEFGDTVETKLENYYLKTEADILHSEIEDYVDNQVAALVNAAPETLDTLGELAAAFEENKTVVEALDASITNKQDKISDTLILVDTVTGSSYKIQIQNGQLVSFPVE